MRAAAVLVCALLVLIAWRAQSQTKPQSERQTTAQTETQTTTQSERQTETQTETQTTMPARPLPPTVTVAETVPVTSGFRGLVLGINGLPCAGATVHVGIRGVSINIIHADDDGVFSIDVPPGDYTLSADDDMGASEPIDLPLAAGERLDGLTLELHEPAEQPRITVETDEDGRKIFRIQSDIIIY